MAKIQTLKLLYVHRHENPIFLHVNNKGADQTVHQHLCYSLFVKYGI